MNDERAREGIEHLQAAALEMIAAARAFLDVAEDLVRDPSGLAHVADLAADLVGGRKPAPAPAEDAEPARVQRIRVS